MITNKMEGPRAAAVRRDVLAARNDQPVALASERPAPTMLQESDLRSDGGTQMRAAVNMDTVVEYAEAMQGGATFPPITVYYDGSAYWIGDGFHRLSAHCVANPGQPIACDVRPGTRRDAILYSAQANAAHGLRRTNADKRRAVETLLRDDEWGKWSDREIARRCHVSQPFVSAVRGEVTDNGYQSERTYTTKHGTPATMQTANINKDRETIPQQLARFDREAAARRAENDAKRHGTPQTPQTAPGASERARDGITTGQARTPVLAVPAQSAMTSADRAKLRGLIHDIFPLLYLAETESGKMGQRATAAREELEYLIGWLD